MIRLYKPREQIISALEWNSKRPHESLSILVNWFGIGELNFRLMVAPNPSWAIDGSLLLFPKAGGAISVADGDFIIKRDGQATVIEGSEFRKFFDLLPENLDEQDPQPSLFT